MPQKTEVMREHLNQARRLYFSNWWQNRNVKIFGSSLRHYKRNKRILLLSSGMGQVSRIIFPWDVEWLHNQFTIALIAPSTIGVRHTHLQVGALSADHRWYENSGNHSPGLSSFQTAFSSVTQVTLSSIPCYFVKAKSCDQDVGGLCILYASQILAHNPQERRSQNYLFTLFKENKTKQQKKHFRFVDLCQPFALSTYVWWY